jgi:hypothetical protein
MLVVFGDKVVRQFMHEGVQNHRIVHELQAILVLPQPKKYAMAFFSIESAEIGPFRRRVKLFQRPDHQRPAAHHGVYIGAYALQQVHGNVGVRKRLERSTFEHTLLLLHI